MSHDCIDTSNLIHEQTIVDNNKTKVCTRKRQCQVTNDSQSVKRPKLENVTEISKKENNKLKMQKYRTNITRKKNWNK